ncbi:MAG: FtsQ-type POTRA domain-containing protein, partial [Thermostichales cyanobacterium BF4_bins_65]
MTSLSSRTVAGRLSRRQQLQRQRAWHFWRTIWHSSLSLGILGGLVLVIRQPLWYLTAPEQIQIQGEALLTDAEIQAKLRLNFPLTLWQVEPQQVAAALLTDPPGLIRAVHLQRQMLPPSLTVWVEERPLLAQATVNGIWGAIDHQGEWISLQDYP